MVRTTNILGDRQTSCVCQSWGAGQVQQKKTPPHTPFRDPGTALLHSVQHLELSGEPGHFLSGAGCWLPAPCSTLPA